MIDTTEGVCVFCRLKPLDNENIEPCIKFQNSYSIIAVPPEGNRRNNKEINYSFTKVFRDNSSQSEVFNEVGYPLVKNLLDNKNGLLFTYGITGSGKSYTMEGSKSNPGIVGRTLKALFSRIKFLIRYRIRPNGSNEFEVQNSIDALFESQSNRFDNLRRSTNGECKEYMRQIEDPFEKILVENCTVFISMVEMSANNVNDLFRKNGPVVRIKEDRRGNKYLSNVREVEVQEADEAFSWYLKGNKRRKTAATECNSLSSRTHCIFNIRLVKLSSDKSDNYSSQASENLCVSQLSLVDLAGSERAKRTGASGTQLKEAGEINKSLTALQEIMKNLRERRKCNREKPFINYRDNALTHLFKTSFEGGSNVHMIVCIQQGLQEYDETINVLKFAEDAKEVRIPVKENHVIPKTLRIPLKQVQVEEEQNIDEILSKLEEDINKLYCELELYRMVHPKELEDDNEMMNVIMKLFEYMDKCQYLNDQLTSTISSCEIDDNSDQLNLLISKLDTERLEKNSLKRRLKEVENELTEERKIFKIKNKVDQKIKSLEEGSVLKQIKLKNQLEKPHRNSIRSNPMNSVKLLKQKFEEESKFGKSISTVKTNRFIGQTPLSTKRGFFNPNFRRSKSGEHYYQHKEKSEIPLGTLNKLNLKNQTSSKKLDLVELKKADKYVLQHQSVIENQFQVDYHSGNVIPTAGGGISVCLTQIESVIHSPYERLNRKRQSSEPVVCNDDTKRVKDNY